MANQKIAPRAKRPPGRPSAYTPELAATICRRIAGGETLRAICRDPGFPCRQTVIDWLGDRRKPEFHDQYAKARRQQLEHWADEILEIAEDGQNDWVANNDPKNPGYRFNGEHFQRSRLRIDTRKWLMSKLNAKKYGDRVAVEADVKVNLGVEQLVAEGAALGLTREQLFGR